MNNEPVAWFEQDPDMKSIWYQSDQDNSNAIPLYTHPAETITLAELRKTELYRTEQTRSLREFLEPKELTDEEITDVYVECMLPYGEFDEHEFARAILRKAQEK